MTGYFHNHWFNRNGAYVLVDGQFGSTGKGLLAGLIAEECAHRITKVTTNAGPNSGHTAYYKQMIPNDKHKLGDGPLFKEEHKIVTQQLPVASVVLGLMDSRADTILNAGAVIDPDILLAELGKWASGPGSRVLIHPLAALITANDKADDGGTLEAIASTGKGVGPAMMRKISRMFKRERVASQVFAPFLPEGYRSWDDLWNWDKDRVFVETAQGFSLGINSARFYPHVTSRECTVMQALADARIPAQMLRKVVACFRTYPIRVGNTSGSSGAYYADQQETTWEALGLEPELTTVTKRVRRVFTWSWTQFDECVATNRPDVLFLNFCNYMNHVDLQALTEQIGKRYADIMGQWPEELLLGFGPRSHDIKRHGEVFG